MSGYDEVLSLMRQAELLYDRAPERALELALRALALAKTTGVAEMESWVEFAVGGNLARLGGRERESLTHLYRSVELVPASQVTGQAWRLIGDVHQTLGESERALAAYAASIDADRRSGDRAGLMWTEGLVAMLLSELGRAGEAVPHFERAIALAPTSGDDETAVQLWTGLGQALTRQRKYSAAADAFRRAVDLARAGGFVMLEGQALHLTIMMWHDQDPRHVPYDELIRLSELNAKIAGEEGDSKSEGASHMLKAILIDERDDTAS